MMVSKVVRMALAGVIAIAVAFTPEVGRATEIKVTLRTEPEVVEAGRSAMLIVDVRDSTGDLVRDLPIVHEKPMHLIIVSADLARLTHIHPHLDPDGSFRVAHTFRYGGQHRVYIDMKAPGGDPMVIPYVIEVRGEPRPSIDIEDARYGSAVAEEGGVRATRLVAGPLKAGEPASLRFVLADARTGKALTDLESYLGTMAHFIIISKDGAEFLHAHTMEGTSDPEGSDHAGHEGHAAAVLPVRGKGMELSAHTIFPRAGTYRVWMQIQRKGTVITLPFVVRVAE